MNERRFKDLSGEELYVLSRALIESSVIIQYTEGSRYTPQEKRVHNALLNEVIDERRYRDYRL